MPPRRRRQSGPPNFRRPLIAAVSLVVLAGGIALAGWAQTPGARMLMADHALPGQQAFARRQIESTVQASLIAIGVDADSMISERGWNGAPNLVRLQAPGDLVELNLALTEAVQLAGGRVLRGERHQEESGEWLELRLGTGSGMTHRLVARRERVAPVPPPLPTGRLALVLDDLGHNLDELTLRAIALPGPVTYAVLPNRGRSRRVLTEIRRAGKQAFLHMPMEPDPGAPVGPGEPVVNVGMGLREIRLAVGGALDTLPGVVGVNNHMGSRVTRSRPEMDAVMIEIAAHGLIFLDSRTTPMSVAHVAASSHGIPNLSNDLFLDEDTEDPEVIRGRLNRLLEISRRRGWAIGIGHIHPSTIAVLEEFLPTVDPVDVQIVPVSELILDGARQPGP